MSPTMRQDAALRPELFLWEGAVAEGRLKYLLEERGWRLPTDLFELLAQTGGGDIFESETILGPFRDAELGDNLFAYNKQLRKSGLSDGVVVFHTGMTLSAVRLTNGSYILLDVDNLQEQTEYASLDEWYVKLLRAEYAERYGLPDVK